MSLPLLFRDELRGFYRSKVMLVLWVGLPVMAVVLYLWSPDPGEDVPLAALVALLVSTLSGTLASIMIVVGIIHERERHVYDLFVIRPIRRRDILLAKFMAVYVCVVVAAALAFVVGLAFDYGFNDTDPAVTVERAADSVTLGLSILAISAAAGILIGIISPSILVGAILVIYMGNQIAGGVGAVATLYLDSNLTALGIAAVVAAVLLAISVLVFDRKQL